MTTRTDPGVTNEQPPEAASGTNALSLPAVVLIGLATLVLGIGIGWRVWGGDAGTATPQVADHFDAFVPTDVAYLGVLARDADTGGALVTRVVAGSPADSAGIHVGDVVVAVDGNPVDGIADLAAEVRSRHPGDEITIGVTRNGAQLELTATLETAPRRR